MAEMIIRTASWFTKPLPLNYTRIAICRGTPHWLSGFRRYPKLNPGPSCWEPLAADEWIRRYHTEVLDRLDPERVAAELQAIAGEGNIPTLLCWERAGSGRWCHRSITARWLAAGLGIAIPELGHEHLPQDAHPMLPRALL
jgi:hypothetical protein